MVIKTKLVHPPENAFAVSAVARGHTLAYTMQKQRKDLIFIFVKRTILLGDVSDRSDGC